MEGSTERPHVAEEPEPLTSTRPAKIDRVLFACTQNAGRSQMAAAFFNQVADPSRAIALSAGTKPAAHVHAMVITAMRELDVDLVDAKPQLLTASVMRDVTLLVTMGCGDACPVVPGVEVVDWQLADPKDRPLEEIRAIRDEIRRRVDALVQERRWAAPPPTIN